MSRSALVLLSLVACGGDAAGDDTGTAATSPCGQVSGSCVRDDGTGCVEWSVADEGQAQEDCEAPGEATWSSGPCDTTGTVGGCLMDMGGTCSVVWYFPPMPPAALASSCSSGEVVDP